MGIFLSQSGNLDAPADITEVVSSAVGGVPTVVMFLLAAMIISGVVVLVLKSRGGPGPGKRM